MNDRITDTIAEALGRHRVEKSMRISNHERLQWLECSECAWRSERFPIGTPESEMESARSAHRAAAVLAALRANNIEPIQLPEPRQIANPTGDDPVEWETGIPDGLVAAFVDPPEVFIDSDSLRPDQARSLAAALLAAAAAAEEGKP